MGKILGFTACSDGRDIDHNDIDVFKAGLTVQRIDSRGFKIWAWGFGDLSASIRRDGFSLGENGNRNLDDRNVDVIVSDGELHIRNDWLGSIPVFYQDGGKVVSTRFNKCVPALPEIDHEGLHYYLEAGYCLYGATPVIGVSFLQANSDLKVGKMGMVASFRAEEDYARAHSGDNSDALIEKIASYLSQETSCENEVIIPTSGGYDSRLLNVLLSEKKKIRSFGYGISRVPEESYEVVFARELSKRLGTNYEHVELGDYNRHIGEWVSQFGASTHAHGMYHIDFYQKILQSSGGGGTIISGIIGDAWAGKFEVAPILREEDVKSLSLSHGVSVEPSTALTSFIAGSPRRGEFFKQKGAALTDGKRAMIELLRTKLVLLNYLFSVPEAMGA